jgi:hypothetical protein
VTEPEVDLPAPRPHPAIAIAEAIATAVTAARRVMTNRRTYLISLNSNFWPDLSLMSQTPLLEGLPLTYRLQ